jgi:hypothetical protein
VQARAHQARKESIGSYQDRPIPWAARFVAHLRNGLPESKRGLVVLAAAVYVDGDGDRHAVIGSSEPDGLILDSVWERLEGDEEIADVRGEGLHAEMRVLAHIDRLRQADPRIRVEVIASSEPVCPPCDQAIRERGIYCPTPRQQLRLGHDPPPGLRASGYGGQPPQRPTGRPKR